MSSEQLAFKRTKSQRYVLIYEDIFMNLDIYEYKIYTALRYGTDFTQEASEVKMSLPYLAKVTGISRAKIARCLNSLEYDHFIIKRTNSDNFAHGKTNVFEVAKHYKYFELEDQVQDKKEEINTAQNLNTSIPERLVKGEKSSKTGQNLHTRLPQRLDPSTREITISLLLSLITYTDIRKVKNKKNKNNKKIESNFLNSPPAIEQDNNFESPMRSSISPPSKVKKTKKPKREEFYTDTEIQIIEAYEKAAAQSLARPIGQSKKIKKLLGAFVTSWPNVFPKRELSKPELLDYFTYLEEKCTWLDGNGEGKERRGLDTRITVNALRKVKSKEWEDQEQKNSSNGLPGRVVYTNEYEGFDGYQIQADGSKKFF